MFSYETLVRRSTSTMVGLTTHPIGLAEADSRRGIFLDALELLDTDPFRKEDEIFQEKLGLWSKSVPSGYVKIAIENGPVEIVDLPIKDCDFP